MAKRGKGITQARASAGIAGASSGTLILGLAKAIPDNSLWKPVVVYLTPWVAVFVASGLAWAQKFLFEYFEERSTRRELRLKDEFLAQAQKTLESALGSQHITSERKQEFQNMLAEIHTIRVNAALNIVNRR